MIRFDGEKGFLRLAGRNAAEHNQIATVAVEDHHKTLHLYPLEIRNCQRELASLRTVQQRWPT